MDSLIARNDIKENIPLTSPSKPKKPSAREFPSTPAGRVPLSDLIGNNEDLKDCTPQGSPVEAVSWNKSPHGSDQNQSFMTPMISRKRKRPRSASAGNSTETKPIHQIKLQANPDLPQNDPAFDLESQYFGYRNQTPSKPASSAAANFITSSSPITPGPAVVDTSKLKRTSSCGMAYPSGNKRRRTETQVDFELIAKPRDRNRRKDGKMQEISCMLDSIHHDLPVSLQISQASSSPEPLPEPTRNNHDTRRETDSRLRISQQTTPDGLVEQLQEDLHESQGSKSSGQSTESDIKELKAELIGLFDEDLADLSMLPDITADEMFSNRAAEQANPETVSGPTKSKGPENHNLNHAVHDNEFDDFSDDELEMLASYCDPEIQTGVLPVNNQPHVSSSPQQPPLTQSPLRKTALAKIIEVSDDEFNDGIDDDFCDNLYAASQVPQQELSPAKTNPLLQQYVIMSVSDSNYEDPRGISRPEKVLRLENTKNRSLSKVVSLRGSWIDGIYPDGCIVHVLGEFDKAGHCAVDDSTNWLIVHPDHLVSATVVADSFSCTRRSILSDRVKATSAATEPLVYGHILHEAFQECLKANRWDDGTLEATLTTICSRYLENLYEINVEPPLAISHLMAKASGLRTWAELFVSKTPKPEAKITDRGQRNILLSVNRLLEVEEHVWSPKYGLKGNIDATVQVVMEEDGLHKTLTVPLELKTGRNTSNASHQAQTALYTLLLSDRYDINVMHGILLYLESSSTSRVTGIRNELVSMIQQRNKIAVYARNRSILPPMLQDARLCGKCYAKTPCFVYHKLVEDGDGKTSGLKEEFNRLVKHLKPAHKQFFINWDSLLSKEETEASRFRKELWTMQSSEREKIGRCFGGLILDDKATEESLDAPKINRYRYTLIKEKVIPGFTFTESQIGPGEPIVISDESGHYALANGYVVSIRSTYVTVVVDRRLENARIRSRDFDPVMNQSFTGIMRVGESRNSHSLPAEIEPVRYRLDKDEFSNGMATVRNNLIRLMNSDAYGSDSLRQLIIEGKSPEFETPRDSSDWLSGDKSLLNVDQQNAIKKVMSAKHYALVLGMPGTGKTTTIAHIIRALVAKGKSVLLTSYTHTAVDNILLKIKNDKISVLRIGAIAKVHPEVQEFADIASKPKTSFEELQQSYSAQVVATTCLGINHAIFNAKLFDYCIVDEASQITLPVCLGPIAMAKRFVLVGDHYQLPPLVQNKEAQEGGLDVSLFKLLSDTHPNSVVNLEHQYRMCEDIMSLSNTLIYSGRLKCGTPAVATASMRIPNMDVLKLHHHTIDTLAQDQPAFCSGPTLGSCWLRDTLDPARRVIFLNTDGIGSGAQEIVKGTRITNPFEVTIATQTVEALLATGVSASDVGVVTLYRSQLMLLKHSLRHRSSSLVANPATSAIEMHTADKFQGRDKEAVILSLVRNNENGTIGDLLQDWRRVNVALTRARTKLVIIGSFNTISRGTELLGRLCTMIQQRGWRYDLREGAGQAHYFDEWRTQTQGKASKEKIVCEKDADDSDIEVGSSGQSPKKKTPKKGSPQKMGSRPKPSTYVNKPFRQVRFAAKEGKTDVARLLSKRVVLGGIMNEVLGSRET